MTKQRKTNNVPTQCPGYYALAWPTPNKLLDEDENSSVQVTRRAFIQALKEEQHDYLRG